MLIFAFPGTGKTSLGQRYPQVIDLEVSDVKFDTRGLSRRAKEAAKALKRSLKRSAARPIGRRLWPYIKLVGRIW